MIYLTPWVNCFDFQKLALHVAPGIIVLEAFLGVRYYCLQQKLRFSFNKETHYV